MNILRRSRLTALLLGPALAIVVSGCVVVPANQPYPYGGSTVEADYGDYYYYPNVQVYYSISTGYYFYRSGGVWLHTRILPRRYFLDPRYRERIRAPRERPFERFRERDRFNRPASENQGTWDWQPGVGNRNWHNHRNELRVGPGVRDTNQRGGPRTPRQEPRFRLVIPHQQERSRQRQEGRKEHGNRRGPKGRGKSKDQKKNKDSNQIPLR